MRYLLFAALSAAIGLTFTSCKTTGEAKKPDRFAAADLNHDGKLSQAEASDYFVSNVFEGRDANHDGKVSWEEWNVPGSGRSKKDFDAADTDKDGALSGQEAIAYGRKRHLFQKDVRAADADHDGYVTKAEAEKYYASKEGPVR
jgi:hypothetical protein